MQDEEIQKATASEPLSLDAEFAMQRSWRSDADKLTFIVCTHREDASLSTVVGGKHDAPERMVGDVNLFLYDEDEDEDRDAEEDASPKVDAAHADPARPHQAIGELEIMIASKPHRGKGLAQETLRAFLNYIQTRLSGIASEFAGPRGMALKYLRVKIDKENVRSLRLFERLGFVRTSAEANYFGEVEMRTLVVGGRLRDVEGKIGLTGFGSEVGYEVEGDQV